MPSCALGLGLNLSRAVLARLHAISGGTPFYALELGRALQRRGDWATPETLEVPRSLDGLIGARLAALDPAAEEIALYAAALSQPTVPVLIAATGAERTQAGLASAEAAGVLEVVGDACSVRPSTPRGRDLRPVSARSAPDRSTSGSLKSSRNPRSVPGTWLGPRLARTSPSPVPWRMARQQPSSTRTREQRGWPSKLHRLTPTDAVDDRRRRLMSAAEHLAVSGEPKRATDLLAGIAAGPSDGPLLAEIQTRRAHLALLFADLDGAATLLREAIPGPRQTIVACRPTIRNRRAGHRRSVLRTGGGRSCICSRRLSQAQELGDPSSSCRCLVSTTWMHALGRPWAEAAQRADALGVPVANVPIIEHPDLQFAASSPTSERSMKLAIGPRN